MPAVIVSCTIFRATIMPGNAGELVVDIERGYARPLNRSYS